MSDSSGLECRSISKHYASGSEMRHVIDGLSFSVKPGEFAVVVGPSGCGKTTLLRCMSGLTGLDSGSVVINGEEVHDVPKNVAVVFQEYNKSLYPWMTLEANVQFPLRGLPKGAALERSREALSRVGLLDSANFYPWQVSGGMQQRAAIARALALRASLVIMDEPFASVDALTRLHLETMLLDIWTEMQFTAVMVTHDIEEAIFLADRVFVLSGRPTRLLAEIPVDLPRPRDAVSTKALPEFLELRKKILGLIEGVNAGAVTSQPSARQSASRDA